MKTTICILTMLAWLSAFGQGYQQKYQTALAAKSPEIEKGLPAGWPVNNTKVPLDYVLTEADIAAGWQLASQVDYDALVAGLRTDYRAYVSAQIEDYFIPARLFIQRLTASEFKIVKAHVATNLASADPAFAMAWETLPAGLVGPPDGATDDRRHCRLIRNVLRDILGFSNNRLDKLFAQP